MVGVNQRRCIQAILPRSRNSSSCAQPASGKAMESRQGRPLHQVLRGSFEMDLGLTGKVAMVTGASIPVDGAQGQSIL